MSIKMDITQYESIDFRRIEAITIVPVWECGKCGGLTTSTITHQSWHDKINKIMTVLMNMNGINENGDRVMFKTDDELQRSGSLSIF